MASGTSFHFVSQPLDSEGASRSTVESWVQARPSGELWMSMPTQTSQTPLLSCTPRG